MSKRRPTPEQIAARLLQMAALPGGVTRSELHDTWNARAQVLDIAAAMVAAGQLHEVRYGRGIRLFATAQAAAAFVPPRCGFLAPLSKRTPAAAAAPPERQAWQPPNLYHVSELLPAVFPRRRELTPVNLPGTRMDKQLEQDAEPTPPRNGRGHVVHGPSWTHDPRYQCAPGEQPYGAGFVAAGIGRCAITGKPWPPKT